MAKMMKCGHSDNARTEDGKPACAICSCREVDDEQPDLTGRKAVCCYSCGSVRDSSFDLAFFKHRPDRDTDAYYCGCFGWD